MATSFYERAFIDESGEVTPQFPLIQEKLRAELRGILGRRSVVENDSRLALSGDLEGRLLDLEKHARKARHQTVKTRLIRSAYRIAEGDRTAVHEALEENPLLFRGALLHCNSEAHCFANSADVVLVLRHAFAPRDAPGGELRAQVDQRTVGAIADHVVREIRR